jgi:hypothetical protein
LKLSMVSQGLTLQQSRTVWKPFFDWVSDAGSDCSFIEKPGTHASKARSWWEVPGNPAMIPDNRKGAPKHQGWWKGDQGQVGAFIHGYESLWLPATLLENQNRQSLVDALYSSSRHKVVSLHFNKGLAGGAESAIAETRRTATHAAACDAFALAIIADGEGPAYPGLDRQPVDVAAARGVAQRITRAAEELKKVAPGAGSYVSESNYFNDGWQESFWGSNYLRLKSVKTTYDPEGLFFVRHGVGTENWSADGFTRNA